MANMNAAVVVSIIDQFSKNGAKFKSTMKSMKGQVRDFAGGMKSGIKAELAPRFDAANFDKQMGVLDARVAKSRAKLMGAVGMALALAAPLKLAAAFDQSFKGLEKVVDAPISRLKQLRKFALETSALVPIAARDLIDIMAEAAQGEVPIKNLERFSLFVANAAIAADMAGKDIGEIFAKITKTYKLNQNGVEALGDSANHLSNKMAAKAAEIFAFTRRAAGAGATLKLTVAQMNAIGASLIAAGVIPATAGTGFEAFTNRMIAGGKKIEAAFKTVGTSRKAVLGEFRKDGAIALVNFLDKVAAKGDAGRKALTDIVGLEYSDDFGKLLANPESLKKALELVANPENFKGSMVAEAAKQASGAEKQWQLLVNKITKAGIVLGDNLLPKFLEIADGVGKLVTSFTQWADAKANKNHGCGAVATP